MSALVGWLGHAPESFLTDAENRLRPRARGAIEHLTDRRYAMSALGDPSRDSASVATAAGGSIQVAFAGALFHAEELARELADAGERLADDRPATLIAAGFARFGDDLWRRLDGAFACALIDRQTLYLVRDALGERVAYYAEIDGAWVFASEIKAILAHPGFTVRPNAASMHKLLVFSFIPGEPSMFEGVREVLPGQVVELRVGLQPRSRDHFTLAEPERWVDDEATSARRIRELCDRAVETRLGGATRVSAFLSGGIDSSSVVAMLAARGVRVSAFSASFGHGQPNELMFARLVAQHTGVDHRVIDLRPEDFLDELPKIIWTLDDPLCDCITVPNYLLAREAARESDLVFNGEGGDPLFGGPKNKFLILGEWYSFLGGYDRARAYLSSYHKFYEYLPSLYTPEFMHETGGSAPLESLVRPYLESGTIAHFLNRLMHLNVKLKGGQNILVKVDKMLSANGVSAASPLFDKALTLYSFAIPPRYKRKGDVEKYVFKKAVEDLLPRSVVYRKKVGMGVPLNHWFRVTKLRDYAIDLLTSARARGRGIFRASFVDDLLGGKGARNAIGQDRSGELLWMLLAIELWYRVFVDDDPALQVTPEHAA